MHEMFFQDDHSITTRHRPQLSWQPRESNTTPTNGDCLYHAILLQTQLESPSALAIKHLRYRTALYLLNNPHGRNIAKAQYNEQWQQKAAAQRNSLTYGTAAELAAISSIIKRPISIMSYLELSTQHNTTHKFLPHLDPLDPLNVHLPILLYITNISENSIQFQGGQEHMAPTPSTKLQSPDHALHSTQEMDLLDEHSSTNSPDNAPKSKYKYSHLNTNKLSHGLELRIATFNVNGAPISHTRQNTLHQYLWKYVQTQAIDILVLTDTRCNRKDMNFIKSKAIEYLQIDVEVVQSPSELHDPHDPYHAKVGGCAIFAFGKLSHHLQPLPNFQDPSKGGTFLGAIIN